MALKDELARRRKDLFVALILDNEVTVGEFVMAPPLPWARIVQLDGVFQIAEGYPNSLTAAQAQFEMKNWDQVALPALARELAQLHDSVDYIVIGNNAGQGLPLAQAVPQSLALNRAAVIYATALPERSAYERLGFRTFFRRSETARRLVGLVSLAGRQLGLFFINSIQHNEHNYHDP